MLCLGGLRVARHVQQIGAEERRRHRADHHPADEAQVDRAGTQVHERADRAHHDRGDEVARDRGRRRDAEQQDQHRRHQRAAAGAGHPDEQADDRAAENDVRVDVHGATPAGLAHARRQPDAGRGTARSRAGQAARGSSTLARRLPEQQPAVVHGPDEVAPGEIGEGAGDGRPACGDEVGEHGVGETERQDHAVGADPAPASGEVPEQHVESIIDPGLVDDRHVDDEPARAAYGALEQTPGEFRVATELAGEASVEERRAGPGRRSSSSCCSGRVWVSSGMPRAGAGRIRRAARRRSVRRSPPGGASGPGGRGIRSRSRGAMPARSRDRSRG